MPSKKKQQKNNFVVESSFYSVVGMWSEPSTTQITDGSASCDPVYQ